jgi:hypothetical protein
MENQNFQTNEKLKSPNNDADNEQEPPPYPILPPPPPVRMNIIPDLNSKLN